MEPRSDQQSVKVVAFWYNQIKNEGKEKSKEKGGTDKQKTAENTNSGREKTNINDMQHHQLYTLVTVVLQQMAKESQKGHLFVHVDENDFLFSLTVKLITTVHFRSLLCRCYSGNTSLWQLRKQMLKRRGSRSILNRTIIFLYTLSSGS